MSACFDGFYYDGTSARSRPIRVGPNGVGALVVHGDELDLTFALSDVRVTPRLARTRRVLRLAGGAQIHTDDNDAVDRLFPNANRLEAFVERLERSWRAVLAALVLTVVATVLFFTVGLPFLAKQVAMHVPFALEQQFGDQALASFDGLGVIEPTALSQQRRDALSVGFADLASGLGNGAAYRLEFRSAPEIGANAFALPGGIVVVTDELIELADDQREVLAVLAHELGHQEHRHAMRQALQGSVLVVVLSAFTGDASSLSAITVGLPTLLIESGYSRGFEEEADAFAIELLQRKDISPEYFATLLERLAEEGYDAPGVYGYMSSHPNSAERIAKARSAGQ